MRFGLFIGLFPGVLTPPGLTLPIATPLERLPVDPSAVPPPTPTCFHLSYNGAPRGSELWLPARILLFPTVLDADFAGQGQAIYRAEGPNPLWPQPALGRSEPAVGEHPEST